MLFSVLNYFLFILIKVWAEFPPFSAFSSGCVRPYMVQNSWVNLTETNRGSFPVGTVLQYSCDPGYLPDGPSILTCTTIGRWSSEPPQCIRSGGKSLHSQTSFLCCVCLYWTTSFLYKKIYFVAPFSCINILCLPPVSMSAPFQTWEWRLHLSPLPLSNVFPRDCDWVLLWRWLRSQWRLQLPDLSGWTVGWPHADQLCEPRLVSPQLCIRSVRLAVWGVSTF